MKSRLHRIEISNFKAFRSFRLDLDGRHLLVYGPNGSAKSNSLMMCSPARSES
jgi:AAA15 family ATPase/GTPase